MQKYLKRVPFDIYELHLFQEVARRESFTKAASNLGMSQSALTRKIQGMESKLDIALFERSTRKVRLTEAGRFLCLQSDSILHHVDTTLIRLQEKFELAPKQIRIGVSKTVSMSYLPGFFSTYKKQFPETRVLVCQDTSNDIVSKLESSEMDIGIIGAPKRNPSSLKVMESFKDRFAFIFPDEQGIPPRITPTSLRSFSEKLELPWLQISRNSNTAGNLESWLSKRGLAFESDMELDSFDLIANLVSLGMGYSCVPIRSLAPYNRKKKIQRFSLRDSFTREIVVLASKTVKLEDHIRKFIELIPFS